MATYHILNGDALLDFFPETILSGEIIVARECLVDGPQNGETLEEFWETRASFIAGEYGEEKEFYFLDVVPEFNKIALIPEGSEVNLWFEEDLFCQVNLWFCVSLLTRISATLKINLVKPPLLDEKADWRGFGALDRDGLAKAYQERQRLTAGEVKLLSDLWVAYKKQNRAELENLSGIYAPHFPFLHEVVKAQLDRFSNDKSSGRPEKVLKEIILDKKTQDFKTIFKEFGAREGIYGFGDWQVESLLKKIPEYQPQD
ncbi:DUF1835 domain-containing protein [Dyadobacter psychrotolerans]|uniref:DUF1835 domain-containing protein n=1 Tax=Dyadobacter psychrotolerans TaxID=2541721 RepID=A0A4R5DUS3_9BACT|nr:DUF1835 domain-containing protein [Dyadobacter psychrotolerans]TDE18252.1 DUF1835 domain-containing protein [Dyadobacter psychrotolerans]